MRGYTYVMTDPTRPGLVKVGFSAKDPRMRAKELDGTGMPLPLAIEYEMLVEDARSVERSAHGALRPQHVGKEWFRCSAEHAISTLQQIAGGRIVNQWFHNANRDAVTALEAKKRVERAAIAAAAANAAAAQRELEAARFSAKSKIDAAEAFRRSAQEQLSKAGDVTGHIVASILLGCVALFSGIYTANSSETLGGIAICVTCTLAAICLICLAIRRRNVARVAYRRALDSPDSRGALTTLEHKANTIRVQVEKQIADEQTRLYSEYEKENENLDSSMRNTWGIGLAVCVVLSIVGTEYKWREGAMLFYFGVLVLWMWTRLYDIKQKRGALISRYRKLGV